MTRRRPLDSDRDALAIYHASRRVAGQLMLTMTLIAVIALAGAFLFVLRRVPPHLLFGVPMVDHRITIGARDMLLAGIGGSIGAVLLAGIMTVLLTRRAVQPLGDALRRQRAFVADASHELRTPLTILDARVQVIQRAMRQGSGVDDDIADLRDDTRALIAIVNDLLDAADTGADDTAPAVELSAVTDSVERAVSPLLLDADVTIECVIEEGLTIAMPTTRVERCLLILIDNALQHSPAGSTITVAGTSRGETTIIRVEDQGAGIRGLDPSRIFDRFAHSDESRTTATPGSGVRPGYGIGLSLVRETAVRFGGDVRVDDTFTTGAAFELTIPARPRRTRRDPATRSHPKT